MKKLILLALILSNTMFLFSACNSASEEAASGNVTADKIIKDLNKGKPVYLKDAVISGDLDFTLVDNKNIESADAYRVYINQSVTFNNCTFEGKVTGIKVDDKSIKYFTCFEKNMTFYKCKFKKEVDFTEASARGIVNFSGSSFEEKAVFEGFSFQFKENYFSDVFFKNEARFHRISVNGSINFLKTTFEGKTSFQKACVLGSFQAGGAGFKLYADFSSMDVLREAIFNTAIFKDKAIFNNVVFRDRAEFNNAVFNDNAGFKKTDFGGKTEFVETSISGDLDLKESVFRSGKPITDKIKIDSADQIKLDGCVFYSSEPVILNDIKK
ncbi:MAG: hypothetical protein A2W91_08160 [Bacteroidetes bacterium GWF2_38_335]|nr:MAG: hypothetical protein A2W91_08160 [Bacteroidetes bacterium GWF2_38_335]